MGGGVNGLEIDEQGNISFDAEKFALGFIGGAGLSKATQYALKNPRIRAKAESFLTKSGEVIKDTLQNSNLPLHAKNALNQTLGKDLAKILDTRSFIQDSKEALNNLNDNIAKLKEDIMLKNSIIKGEDMVFTYKVDNTQIQSLTLRNELKEALKPIINHDIVNKNTNIVGRITNKEFNKISSSKAVGKSKANGFSKEEHFAVARDLKQLFENATLKETHADTKAREAISNVLRFQKDIKVNSKNAVAKITLFEKKVGANKIYTIELDSLGKPLS